MTHSNISTIASPPAAATENVGAARRIDINAPLQQLRAYIESQNFAGYDPYDGLNSPLLRWASLGLKYPRIAAIQAMKRSPINLRPWLFVPKGHNPKGLGLFLGGYAKIYKATGDETALPRVDELLALLRQTRSSNCSGNGWGYNFDWQSRAFFVPKHTPTVVNSSFIGHALLDTYEYCGRTDALDMALPIREFILRDLNRTWEGKEFCLSYTPIDSIAVHNANLLGASLLIRLDQIDPHDEAREAALACLRYSMRYQHDDGSWWYAEPEYQHWIDSFHTGFNLQSIQYFLDAGMANQYQENFERGVAYYADHFFLADGAPKYYHNKQYPLDIHSYAQAIVFFCRQNGRFDELVDRIIDNLLTTMRDSRRGYFYFQRNATQTNTIPYIRWGQAWSFHALTEHMASQALELGNILTENGLGETDTSLARGNV